VGDKEVVWDVDRGLRVGLIREMERRGFMGYGCGPAMTAHGSFDSITKTSLS
jgi:hypothetical protein